MTKEQKHFSANCIQLHCFDLSGLFSAVGDRQQARETFGTIQENRCGHYPPMMHKECKKQPKNSFEYLSGEILVGVK